MTNNDNSASNKRIAKNTLLLYFRMAFMMVVNLYTSRVVLNALGVEDYGIYNVVGGVVMMFTMLSGSLSAAISRFITFELGTGNIVKLKKVFSSSVTIQIGLALIIIFLAESIGLWFLNAKMIIPDNRLAAANWCFQFSILTFSVNLISVPYNAAIIAHEKMAAFAYISILESLGRLFVAWIIVYNPFDRLIYYATLLALVACIIRFLYGWYCKNRFEECRYRFIYDHDLLKQMFSFAGWNFFGAGSFQLMTQGINLLMNVYFGVVVNAARGIAVQVEHAVTMFVNSFTTAINPQITKSYASYQKDYMFELMFRGAKFSYFLVLYFAIPLLCETKIILELWLKQVPDHTIWFVRLAVFATMITVLSNTMVTAMLATGNIKKYQIIVGGIGMLVFPLAWLLFTIGYPPEIAYIVTIIICIIQLICRLYLMREMIGMSIKQYMEEVLLKSILTSLFAFALPCILCFCSTGSFTRFFFVCIISVLLTSIVIFSTGLNSQERNFVIRKINTLFNR